MNPLWPGALVTLNVVVVKLEFVEINIIAIKSNHVIISSKRNFLQIKFKTVNVLFSIQIKFKTVSVLFLQIKLSFKKSIFKMDDKSH